MAADASALALGCNALPPCSNRIADGEFAFDGTHHRVGPNLEGEPPPIRGDAFQRRREVDSASRAHVRLRLENGGIGPWRHRAALDDRLRGRELAVPSMRTTRTACPDSSRCERSSGTSPIGRSTHGVPGP